MENLNGSILSVEVKTDEKENKKLTSKLSTNEKPDPVKPKSKETTPKNKQKEQDNLILAPIPTIDTNLDLNGKKDNEQSNEQAISTSSEQAQIDYSQVVKCMSLDDVFINLNLIAKIEIGDKLYINDKYINIDTSYVQPILRWYYGIDRKSTINFVRLVIGKSFEYCDTLIKSDNKMLFRLTNDLRNSISGLTKLKQTYIADKLVQAEIDVIIEDIRAKIESTLVIN